MLKKTKSEERVNGTSISAVSLAALGFLLPNLLGFALFTLIPVLASFLMGFTNWSLKPAIPFRFLGLENFVEILGVQKLGQAPVWLPVSYYAACALAGLSGLAVVWMLLGGRRRFLVYAILGIVAGTGLLVLLDHPMWASYAPQDKRFWHYLLNTLVLMVAIPPSIAGSLALAMLLNEKLELGNSGQRTVLALWICVFAVIGVSILWMAGQKNWAILGGLLWLLALLGLAFNTHAYRAIFYLPTFTSGVALMILWKSIYNPQSGLLNHALSNLLEVPIADLPLWLSSVAMSKPSLIFMNVWLAVGGMNMLLYLAALTNIPNDLLEAANIDGANRWQRFRHVYWPQLAPTTFFISIMSVIGGLQGGFEQAKVMTGGGPAGSTTTLAYYIYTLGFEDLALGRAAAVSWMLFLLLFVFTAAHWKLGKDQDV